MKGLSFFGELAKPVGTIETKGKEVEDVWSASAHQETTPNPSFNR